MRPYKCIFFDLDHTLWDYDTNSCSTLRELYSAFGLQTLGITDCDSFEQQFKKVNLQLWDLYDRGLIGSEVIRRERFKQILQHFNINDEKLCIDLSAEYMQSCPRKGTLLPYALETLNYLSDRYSMTVVTNGFEEVQHIKLTAGNLHRFFTHIVTSQKAGYKKPSREIFDYAMKANNVLPNEVIMIGDNLVTDIGGARNAAIDTVFFNPERVAHDVAVKHEISSLAELQNIL
jgi:YjjG family noncanonical pyrimidine nucleotidase